MLSSLHSVDTYLLSCWVRVVEQEEGQGFQVAQHIGTDTGTKHAPAPKSHLRSRPALENYYSPEMRTVDSSTVCFYSTHFQQTELSVLNTRVAQLCAVAVPTGSTLKIRKLRYHALAMVPGLMSGGSWTGMSI